MKWSKDEIKQLKELNKYKHPSEIAVILNRTLKAIRLKLRKEGLRGLVRQVEYYEIIKCLECSKEIRSLKCNKRKFCSRECHGIYNGRFKTRETIEKQRKTLLETNSKKSKLLGKYIKKKRNQKLFCKLRYCIHCKTQRMFDKKSICPKCKIALYKFYRPACVFKFSIKDFSFAFSLEEITLIEQFGMYTASNRGNNINGTSRDHIYSVIDGFKNKIPPFILSHPANCRIVKHVDNQKKHGNSHITIEELYNRIVAFEKVKPYLSNEDSKITLPTSVRI